MKILFIDESDKQKDKNNKYFFVLNGLMVDKESLLKIESDIRNLKKNNKINNFKELRSKGKDRLSLTKEIYEILNKNSVKIISAVLGPRTMRDSSKKSDDYMAALGFIIERFYINLDNEKKVGLVIHDSVDKDLENQIREKFYEVIIDGEFIMRGEAKGLFRNKIYPSIFFSKDEHSEILQTSDLIAVALNSSIFKSLEKAAFDTDKLSEHNEFLKIYWPLFIKNPRGGVSGWGIKVWW